MKKRVDSNKNFTGKNTLLIIFVVLAVLICYGKHALSTNVGVDTEQYILGAYGKDWVIQGLGRFGYYYSIMLLNLGHYNPYMNGVAFLITYSLAIISWCYVFYLISGKMGAKQYILFATVFLTNPLWATHFYFSLQQSAIALGLLCQAFSFLLLFDLLIYGEKNTKVQNGIELVFSILLALYAIGTYQSFAGLHLSEAAACLLLLFEKLITEDSSVNSHKIFWKKFFIVVMHFFISYGLYTALCKVMNWGTSDYLQLKWGKKPASEILWNLCRDFKNILIGGDVYAGYAVLVSCVILLLLVIRMLASHQNIWIKLDYIFLIVGNIVCMIALNIVIGEIPVDRARLPVAFGTAFLGMYALSRAWDIKRNTCLHYCLVISACLVMILSVGEQLSRSQTLFYTEDVCNMQEYEVGAEIVRDIKQLGGDSQTSIVFVGKWSAPLNPSCRIQRPIGVSSFEWDYKKKDPANVSRRAGWYLNAAFGTNYNVVFDKEVRKKAVDLAKKMPCYPMNGYIQKMDNVVVVKLGDF